MAPAARRLKERALTVAVLVTTLVVVVFSWLQYRWSREVTEATGVRLADTLQMSMVNWHVDLARNLDEIARTLRVDASTEENLAATLLARLREWQAVAHYPDLVRAIYLFDATAAHAARLAPDTGRFEPTDWPAGMPSAADLRHLQAPVDWRFDPRTPALWRRVPLGGDRAAGSWLAVSLSQPVLRTRVLPDLANRYFQGIDGLDYEVGVAAGSAPRQVLYASDPGFASTFVENADGTLNVFGRGPLTVFHETSQRAGERSRLPWLPLLRDQPPRDDWELVVRHRRGGPLGAFLTASYRRDLVFSLGGLVLLVASIAMLVVASLRAQRLASLQMDFVTTVSHELRTPLTVIGSAADNIAQGIVEGRDQLKQYGTVIGNQVGQLSTLVEQILLFATHSRKAPRFSVRPVEVSHVVRATLERTDSVIRAAQFRIDCDVPGDLPPVLADLDALTQSLQNLITNALKYRREERWIGIRARRIEGHEPEVRIEIADRGLGISATDLPHIFEPFYRSPAVSAAQIHGTGLGLALARRMIEAMGGRISVVSDPGRGSTFAVHLRCATGTADAIDVAITPAAHRG
jgi:signal transduction histidine kinase